MKNLKNRKVLISLIIVIQTIIFIIVGINKSYIHMDEGYSLGLANYHRVEIQDEEDFYNKWHSGEYYNDYLAVQEYEVGEFKQVYENQKNDVHPPVYYLLLRIAMGFNIGSYSKWTGIILNIIIFAFITIFMYLISKKIFQDDKKALIISFISSITMSSLTNVIYIRMYALSTLNILITTYLHFKLFDSEKLNIKLLIVIGVSALIGSLTHYYYLFFLAMLFIIFVVKYIKEHRIKELIGYFVTMVIAGASSLIIFPYSIKHMFFGYRGQGVISKLTDITQFIASIASYIYKVNRFVFNNILLLIVIACIVIYIKYKKEKLDIKNKYMKLILLPTLFYFLIVSVASPWIELRYIMPICSLIFVIVMYYLIKLLGNVFTEKTANIILYVTIAILLVSPIVFRIEPEVAYTDKKEIVNKLKGDYNIPTLYLFNSGHNRFLDDIYLFSILDNSYIAKDIKYIEENIKNILENKDLSKGIVLFINENQDNDSILEVVKKAIDANSVEYMKRLNACDVYYIK